MRVTLLTDTDALKRAGNDVLKAAADTSTGHVRMGQAAAGTFEQRAKDYKKIGIITRAQVAAILHEQTTLLGGTINTLRNPTAQGFKAVFGSPEGRLAIGGLLVQIISLIASYPDNFNLLGAACKAYADKVATTPDDIQAKEMALLGVIDGFSSVTGNALQMLSIYEGGKVTAKFGAAAANTNVWGTGFSVLSNLAGAVGGYVNFAAMMGASRSAEEKGDHEVSFMYQASAIAFFGTMGTSGAAMAGAVAENLAARHMGGTIIAHFGARGSVAVLGLTASGVGLFLLVAGVALQLGAIAMTPNAIEKWVSFSYFGRNKAYFFKKWGGNRSEKSFTRGNWDYEFDQLLVAFGSSAIQYKKEQEEREAKALAEAKKLSHA